MLFGPVGFLGALIVCDVSQDDGAMSHAPKACFAGFMAMAVITESNTTNTVPAPPKFSRERRTNNSELRDKSRTLWFYSFAVAERISLEQLGQRHRRETGRPRCTNFLLPSKAQGTFSRMATAKRLMR